MLAQDYTNLQGDDSEFYRVDPVTTLQNDDGEIYTPNPLTMLQGDDAEVFVETGTTSEVAEVAEIIPAMMPVANPAALEVFPSDRSFTRH